MARSLQGYGRYRGALQGVRNGGWEGGGGVRAHILGALDSVCD